MLPRCCLGKRNTGELVYIPSAGVLGLRDTDMPLREDEMQPKIEAPAHVSPGEKDQGLGWSLWVF